MGTTFIDDDFVLNASSPKFSKKPLVLTNSEITGTTGSLSYNTLRSYSPGRYSVGRRTVSPTLARELRRSMSPSELKRSLNNTRESGRSRSHQRFESYNNRLQRSLSRSPVRSSRGISPARSQTSHHEYEVLPRSRRYDSDDDLEYELADSNFKERMYRKTSDLATWSTDPVHLKVNTEPQQLRNSVRLSRRRSRSPSPYYRNRSRSISPVYRSSSPVANSSRSWRSSRRSSVTRLYDEFPVTGTESLAKDNFPVTMSAYKIEHLDPPMSRSMMTSPPPKHLRPKVPHKWRMDGKVDHITRGVDYLDDEPHQADDISKMYNMADYAPSIAASTIHMISPYASDLAHLRLGRLRIEENHLLEAKRLAEIERLRGPKEKWYELKTPDFHTEAQKNNELINNKERWNDILDYRSSVRS